MVAIFDVTQNGLQTCLPLFISITSMKFGVGVGGVMIGLVVYAIRIGMFVVPV